MIINRLQTFNLVKNRVLFVIVFIAIFVYEKMK
nr:MAG TPA: hypothetical protein [Caudoviricetes sp.]